MNTQTQNLKAQKGERGNVLFLILIAVALFAALSYAVTQSTRSGGGDASKEKSLVSSAALTQYPASIKTAIIRMTVSNGIAPEDLLFDKPPYTNLTTALLKSQGVFYPDTGGGATYVKAPTDSVTTGGDWFFNGENEVLNIGTSVASSATASTAATADIIAFLPDVTKSICDKIHDQLGIDKVTYETFAADITDTNQADPGIDFGGVVLKGDLAGQPQGCFLLSANRYAYYHVLVER